MYLSSLRHPAWGLYPSRTPGSYKDIDAVMAAQADLVSIEYTLKQVLCVKG